MSDLINEARAIEDKARQFDIIRAAVQDYMGGRPADDVFGEIVIAALRDEFDPLTVNDPTPRYPIADALETIEAVK